MTTTSSDQLFRLGVMVSVPFWGCGSESSGSSPLLANGGACVMTDLASGAVRACSECLPKDRVDFPGLEESCLSPPSAYLTSWKSTCPVDPVNGCYYPPGPQGGPAGLYVWYYGEPGGCTSEGTRVNPDKSPAE